MKTITIAFDDIICKHPKVSDGNITGVMVDNVRWGLQYLFSAGYTICILTEAPDQVREWLSLYKLDKFVDQVKSNWGSSDEYLVANTHVFTSWAQAIQDINIQGKLVVWLTGLPCSGKTTLADELEREVAAMGHKVERLDGDVLRKGLCRDLGFSDEDRMENLRRVAILANGYAKHNIIPICSFVSPTNACRSLVREIIGDDVTFFEVYVRCSIGECIRRDVKGMYKLAMDGEIDSFTGISAPFEEPHCSDIVVDSDKESIVVSTDKILSVLMPLISH